MSIRSIAKRISFIKGSTMGRSSTDTPNPSLTPRVYKSANFYRAELAGGCVAGPSGVT